jgi:hypothetical protein
MYDPFVLACNFALDKLSEIKGVGELPAFLPRKQIAFARNHDRAILSGNLQRESRVRPDIVLLHWDTLKAWRRNDKKTHYSRSYKTDLCTSPSDHPFNWRITRSTVEMKLSGLPKSQEWNKEFKTDFRGLPESLPYTSLHNPQPGIFRETPPAIQCEFASFRGILPLIPQ